MMCPTVSANTAATCGIPGVISPMKSASIWKSIASASGLFSQWPEAGGSIPFRTL